MVVDHQSRRFESAIAAARSTRQPTARFRVNVDDNPISVNDVIDNTDDVLERLRAAGIISDAPADVPNDYVYSNGVCKADVLAAIQAAGLAEQYGFAEKLCVYYNLMVCGRCAGPDPIKRLFNMGHDSWGSVCEPCAQLIGRRAAQRWTQHLK